MSWVEEFNRINDAFLSNFGAPHSPLYSTVNNAEWLLLVLAIFLPLAYLFPSKRSQPLLRKDMLTDCFYWFVGPFLYNPVSRIFFAAFLSFGIFKQLSAWGGNHLSTLPIWLQAFLILLIGDVLQYWLHRIFHRDPWWKYHAIHHSATQVDSLTSARFHPINIILYSISVNVFVATLGFSTEAFYILLPFNMIYSPLVHANVPWTYGPFKYVMASPVFHRWHHTGMDEGGNKNFAPTFAFLDVMFGTFYMPKGKQPENFGIEGNPVPDNIIGQLLYPFQQKQKS